jgi:SAM-dependent methyltransferase
MDIYTNLHHGLRSRGLWCGRLATAKMAANEENAVHIDVDTFEDEAYSSGSSTAGTSYVSSVASIIRNGVEENGRRYPAYGRNMYGLPVDEKEQERNDLQHAKFRLIIGGALHLAPMPPAPERILDLGTGSGIWAIEAADQYETATVTGVDIAATQPTWVPPNCQFEVLDIEDEWVFPQNTFDFIHARELIMAIRDWDRLFRQAYDHLRPGAYLEVGGTYPTPRSDDNTLAADSFLKEVERLFFEMADAMGTSLHAPTLWKAQLERAGFVDTRERIFKIPQGIWPRDRRLKEIGAFENYSLTNGLDAYLLRGYTAILGGDPNVLQIIIAGTKSELRDPRMHSYVY